jgi:hypothetical protein
MASLKAPADGRNTGQRLMIFLIIAAALEVLWTIYLGLRLPRDYVANHWDLTWVGLDIAEIIMMLLTAWTAWHRRAMFIIFASVLATLLLMDAWFDVTTAHRGDLSTSKLSAGFLEVPFALILLWFVGRAIPRVVGPSGREEQREKQPLWKLELTPRRPEIVRQDPSRGENLIP